METNKSCLVCVLFGSIFVGTSLMMVLLIELQVSLLTALLYTMPIVAVVTAGGCLLCYRLSQKRRFSVS